MTLQRAMARLLEILMQLTASLPSALLVSLALLACSDPAPPVAQGGLQFTTSAGRPVVSGKQCTTPASTVGVGNPPPDLSGTQPGNRIVDGEGASISCRVSGSNEVTFSADVSGTNVNPDNPMKVSFQINGTLKADGTGAGNVYVSTPDAGTLQNDAAQPCTIEGVVTNGQNNWGSGIIWAKFNCNAMVNLSSPGVLCGTSGTLVLENCEE